MMYGQISEDLFDLIHQNLWRFCSGIWPKQEWIHFGFSSSEGALLYFLHTSSSLGQMSWNLFQTPQNTYKLSFQQHCKRGILKHLQLQMKTDMAPKSGLMRDPVRKIHGEHAAYSPWLWFGMRMNKTKCFKVNYRKTQQDRNMGSNQDQFINIKSDWKTDICRFEKKIWKKFQTQKHTLSAWKNYIKFKYYNFTFEINIF